MRQARRAVAALRRDQRGLTLVELMVAASLGLVVVGGALAMFMGGVRSEPRTASKVAAIQQARTTLDRITRELRQGLEVPMTSPTPSTSELAVVTYVKAATCGGAPASTSIPCRVTYKCSAGSCTRQVAQPNGAGAGPAVEVVNGLTDPTVFEYIPELPAQPTYVSIAFALAADGSPVTLEDGVALRNLGAEA